jgi:hypothetical protein
MLLFVLRKYILKEIPVYAESVVPDKPVRIALRLIFQERGSNIRIDTV